VIQEMINGSYENTKACPFVLFYLESPFRFTRIIFRLELWTSYIHMNFLPVTRHSRQHCCTFWTYTTTHGTARNRATHFDI